MTRCLTGTWVQQLHRVCAIRKTKDDMEEESPRFNSSILQFFNRARGRPYSPRSG
jgi:hypothetical protein